MNRNSNPKSVRFNYLYSTIIIAIIVKLAISCTRTCNCNKEINNQFINFRTTVINSTDSTFWKHDSINTIEYNSNKNTSTFYFKNKSNVFIVGKICNTPTLIRKWNFNENKKIDLTINCDFHPPCKEYISTGDDIRYDMEITKLNQVK